MISLKSFIFFTFISLCLSATVPSLSHSNKCVLPIKSNTHWKVFWPLVFRVSGTLYPVKETEIQSSEELGSELDVVVTKGEEILISCGPNYIASEGRTTAIKVICDENGKFQTVKGETKDAKDLSCDLRSIEEVIAPVDGCPKSAKSGKFGYVHPIDHTTRIIGESCYLEDEGRTLYAHVRLGQDAAEDSISKETLDHKYFIGKDFPSSRYKLDFMKYFRLDQFKDRMKLILGDKGDIPHYQMGNYIDIEHLISNKQFFAAKKLVWNYFPLFDSQEPYLNAVRKDIVELSKSSEIDVYTGSHGVTQLFNSNGEKIPIYLDVIDNKYPIPKYIWFIVKNNKNTYGLVVANDPNATIEDSSKICSTSQCNKLSWLKNSKSAGLLNKRNKLICCDYSVLRNTIPEIPDIAVSSKF